MSETTATLFGEATSPGAWGCEEGRKFRGHVKSVPKALTRHEDEKTHIPSEGNVNKDFLRMVSSLSPNAVAGAHYQVRTAASVSWRIRVHSLATGSGRKKAL